MTESSKLVYAQSGNKENKVIIVSLDSNSVLRKGYNQAITSTKLSENK